MKKFKGDVSVLWWRLLQYSLLFTLGVLMTRIVMNEYLGQSQTQVQASGLPYFLGIFLAMLGLRQTNLNQLLCHPTSHKSPDWLVLVAMILVILGIQTLTTLYSHVLATLLHRFNYGIQAQVEASSANSTTWGMWLYSVILAPLTEELVFRGYILGNLKQYGRSIALGLSAFMFGLYHMNAIQTPFAFAIGLILGYLALEYGLVWAIIFHLGNNLFSEIMNQVTDKTWLMVDNFAGLVGIAVIIYLGVKFFKIKVQSQKLKEKLVVSLWNPPAVIYLAYCFYTIVESLNNI